MKKIFCVALALLIVASAAWAVNFAPTKMTMTVPAAVQYNFDGSTLKIPMTIGGYGGLYFYGIYSKDKAASVSKVRNGFLGWHYVNKIDTSIFISKSFQAALGSNDITWDGLDENKVKVPEGTYTYIVFMFADGRTKIMMNNVFNPGGSATILTKGTDGTLLANPIIYNNTRRWTIGSDPVDKTLVETTSWTTPSGWSAGRAQAVDPKNFNNVYRELGNLSAGQQCIIKNIWIPGGVSTIDTQWADGGLAKFPAKQDNEPGVVTDGQYLYTADSNHHLADPVSMFYIYDFDGSLVKQIDLADWWSNVNDSKLGQMNGGPNFLFEHNGKVFLNCHCSCIKQMVDPIAGLDDDKEFIQWSNTNGDYFLDHNETVGSSKAWICNDFNVAPEVYCMDSDAAGWTAALTNYIGAVSFGILGPDGTGAGYFAYAGETANRFYGNEDGGTMFIETGGAYDGIYVDNYTSADTSLARGTWYVPHASGKGVISKQVGVAAASPSSFSVAQNVPNPFNPSTAISFITPKTGAVTVEVYNTAGQKVETVYNGIMAAGNHTVTWNAGKCSAGVYFATVKNGNISKTVKMTLMK